ncbi:beta strand repeat-containing protein [Oceanibaculum pacificum]|uniref:Calcium-binding protein n=1 Tax=Oceanibaculum pacificum TaxID=580166 RepID=A0A154VYZ0_9PROT|nr:calcium-binding protein [Oceanibaculum pacificum]KZD06447.1 hypothetical protein AUP43_10670 [Oceanibaculum pacificum]
MASTFIVGTDDADLLNGAAGNDTIRGLGGDDTINGSEGNDDLDGGEGNDLLIGGAGADSIQGGFQSDTIEGGAGDDVLRGGKGLDSIDGGAGDDTIYSGLGEDTLIGGLGADVFVVRGADSNFPNALLAPTITDFNAADGDTIAIQGATSEDIAEILASQETVEGGVQLTFGDTVIVVEGVSSLDVTQVLTEDEAISDPADEGLSLDLTTGDDALEGSARNDTFSGGLGTLNANDIVEGGAGDDVLNVRLSGAGGAATIIGVERFNIETIAAASSLALTNVSGLETVGASGDEDLALTAADSDLTGLNLAGFGGDFSVAYEAGAFDGDEDAVTVTLGGADDMGITIADVDSDEIETLNIVAGGAGASSAALTLTNVTVGEYVITGAQALELTAAALNGATVDASGATGTVTLVTAETTVDGSDFDGVDQLNLTGATAAVTVNAGVVVELQAATAAVASIVQNDADVAGSLDDELTVNLNGDAAAVTFGSTSLTIDDIETINLVSTTQQDDPSATTNTVTALNADSLETLNISGDTNLVIDFVDQVDILNASELTGNLDADLSTNTQAVQLTSGAGDDVLVGSDFNDAITGGAGDDEITGGAGVDVATGGDGEDNFIFSTADIDTTLGAVTDEITDFVSGTDTIELTVMGAGDGTTYVEATEAADSLADLLTAAGTALDGTVTIYVGQVGSDSYVVTDADGTGYTDVIKLTGVALDGVEAADFV